MFHQHSKTYNTRVNEMGNAKIFDVLNIVLTAFYSYESLETHKGVFRALDSLSRIAGTCRDGRQLARVFLQRMLEKLRIRSVTQLKVPPNTRRLMKTNFGHNLGFAQVARSLFVIECGRQWDMDSMLRRQLKAFKANGKMQVALISFKRLADARCEGCHCTKPTVALVSRQTNDYILHRGTLFMCAACVALRMAIRQTKDVSLMSILDPIQTALRDMRFTGKESKYNITWRQRIACQDSSFRYPTVMNCVFYNTMTRRMFGSTHNLNNSKMADTADARFFDAHGLSRFQRKLVTFFWQNTERPMKKARCG